MNCVSSRSALAATVAFMPWIAPAACGRTIPSAEAIDASTDGGDAGRLPSSDDASARAAPDVSTADASASDDVANSGPDANVDASDWVLPDATGATWRTSPSPFCGTLAGYLDMIDMWSDGRGVFLAISSQETDIEFNGGTGWSPVYRSSLYDEFHHLNGFNDGPLVLSGQGPCGIQFVANGVATCSGALSDVWRSFVVDDHLAYAIHQDRVLRYDGNYWSQLGDPLVGSADATSTSALWASPDAVVVVGNEGGVYRYRGGASVPDTRHTSMRTDAGGPPDNLTVWGFAADDVWIGNTEGQLVHDDGQNFSVAWSGQGDCRSIRSMWGSDGVLFFATGSSVMRWKDGAVDTVMAVPCDLAQGVMVRSLWGNSPSEVFIAVQDVDATSCGSAKLFWFNGDRLAPL